MTQGLLFFGLIIVVINLVAGYLQVKRNGKWQYGVVNWGIALMIALLLLEKVSQSY